jgi:hypothetical protein
MAILVICFVFRNMPVGMRAGIAGAGADRPQSMEEASQTMGAGGRHDAAPRGSAADPAGDLHRAGLLLRHRDDGVSRRDLPRLGAAQHGDRLHHGRVEAGNTRSPSPIRRC